MGVIANVKLAILGYFRTNTISEDAVNLAWSVPYSGTTAPAATAGTGLADATLPGVLVRGGTFKSARWGMLSGTTAAASVTDYATINIFRKRGSTTYLLFSLANTASAFSAGTSLAMSASNTNLVAAAGDMLGYNIVKTGSGVSVYDGSFSIEFEQTD